MPATRLPSGSDSDLEFLVLAEREGEGGHEFGDVFEVPEVHEFDGRVHVAVREADQGAGNAAPGPEDDVGVGAGAGRHGFVLEGDSLGGGDCLEAADDFDVVATSVGQGWALAHADFAVLAGVHGWVVGGMGNVHDERGGRVEGVGDLAGPEEADFFLDVGDGADFPLQMGHVRTKEAEGFSDGPGADAVVEGAGHGDVAPEDVELIGQGDGIADADELEGLVPGGGSDVDEEIVNLGGLWVAIAPGEVGSDVADHAFDRTVAGVDDDPLGLGNGGVDASGATDVDEAFRGDEGDGHGDLVGMGGQHEARAGPGVQGGDTIAVGVRVGRIGVGLGVIEPDTEAAGFVTDGAGGVDEISEELKRFSAHVGEMVVGCFAEFSPELRGGDLGIGAWMGTGFRSDGHGGSAQSFVHIAAEAVGVKRLEGVAS